MELIKLIQKSKPATRLLSVLQLLPGAKPTADIDVLVSELKRTLLKQDITDDDKQVLQVLLTKYANLKNITIKLLQNNQNNNNR